MAEPSVGNCRGNSQNFGSGRSVILQSRPFPNGASARQSAAWKESVAFCLQGFNRRELPLYTNQPAKIKTDRVLVKY
jgi:hypothetical protein